MDVDRIQALRRITLLLTVAGAMLLAYTEMALPHRRVIAVRAREGRSCYAPALSHALRGSKFPRMILVGNLSFCI
jgi:hypothetical protein